MMTMMMMTMKMMMIGICYGICPTGSTPQRGPNWKEQSLPDHFLLNFDLAKYQARRGCTHVAC